MPLMVTSHQPALLPWIGFWNKVLLSDMLILSCGVEYTRGGYINRVKGRDGWITVPVLSPTQGVPINKVAYRVKGEKIVKGLRIMYGSKKSKYASRLDPVYEVLLDAPVEGSLCDLNCLLLRTLMRVLAIPTMVVYDLNPRVGDTAASRWESRILEITGGGVVYLAGAGIRNYLQEQPEKLGVLVQDAHPNQVDETILHIIATNEFPLEAVNGFCEWVPL